MSFTNFHRQMKAPFVTYADLKSLLRKIHSCDLPKTQEKSFAVKTEMHEPCRSAHTCTIVRGDGVTYGPVHYRGIVSRGEEVIYVFCNVF